MILTRTVDARSEVLSLADVKSQLRITTTADDDSLRAFIKAIRKRVEKILGKTLIESTWQLQLDCFPDRIVLPMGPVTSITTISYIDTDGNPQTFTDFQFDSSGRLEPAYNFSWPAIRDQLNAVTITYVAGATHAGNVEADVKHAMQLLIGAADVGREDTVIGAGVVVTKLPDGAEELLFPNKTWNF